LTSEITLSYDGRNGETVRITATPSMMHPEQCTFRSSVPLYPENSAHFATPEDSHGSPLIDALFKLGDVGALTVTHDSVRVTLTGNASWDDVIPRVGAAMRDVINADGAPISDDVTDLQLPPEELQQRVQQVLDSVINPAVASHGGMVSILDVANNTVYLQFGGGCQGCGMVGVTLKYGVERSIREEVPEIGEILDTTDHASGRNPYYAPSSK